MLSKSHDNCKKKNNHTVDTRRIKRKESKCITRKKPTNHKGGYKKGIKEL